MLRTRHPLQDWEADMELLRQPPYFEIVSSYYSAAEFQSLFCFLNQNKRNEITAGEQKYKKERLKHTSG